jgi:hypothetical protein
MGMGMVITLGGMKKLNFGGRRGEGGELPG